MRHTNRKAESSLPQKQLHYRGGGHLNYCPASVYVGIGPVVSRARVWLTRYFIVVSRPLFAAALVARRRYLYRGAETDACGAAQVLDRFTQARGVRNLIVVPRPSPAAPFVVDIRYLIVSPGRCPRHRSLCVADTWLWCPGRCPRRHSFCIAGLCSFILVPRPLPAAALVVRRRYFNI
jgi:hypothetical protein